MRTPSGGGAAAMINALLVLAQIDQHKRMQSEIERLGLLVRDTARGKLGTLQGASFGLPAWDPLADSTNERRRQRGFPEDEPLLVERNLYNDLTSSPDHNGMGVSIGIPANAKSAPYARTHELGSLAGGSAAIVPQRAYLVPALLENQDEIKRALPTAVIETVVNK